MSLIDVLLTIAIQVLFCLGFRTLLSDGMILHFIRKPFEKAKGLKREMLKPIIICVVCFSSFWGACVFYLFHGFSYSLIPYIILCSICTAFVIKIINDKISF